MSNQTWVERHWVYSGHYPRIFAIPGTHVMQKPSVNQGLYQSCYYPADSTTSTYSSSGCLKGSNPWNEGGLYWDLTGFNIEDHEHPADYVSGNIRRCKMGPMSSHNQYLSMPSSVMSIWQMQRSSHSQPRCLCHCTHSRLILHSIWNSTIALPLAS